jgi:aryl-alcohol dehydrogenase-like predicted oxidoreductase
MFARARELSLVALALGGLLAQSTVGSVIAGATSAEQVRINATAADVQLSLADLAELSKKLGGA